MELKPPETKELISYKNSTRNGYQILGIDLYNTFIFLVQTFLSFIPNKFLEIKTEKYLKNN